MLHKHRKHHNQQFLVVEKRSMRMKRRTNLERIVEFTAENSPYSILKNVTIHAEQTPYFQINDNKFDIYSKDAHKKALNVRNYRRNDDTLSTEGNAFKLRSLTKINLIGQKRAAKDCLAVSNCSNNGECIDLNVCRCNVGYEGIDCAQISCSALKNCSQNGYCIAPNICKCFDGWQQQDCSEPTCHLINNCSGHGTCVSRNECECEPMFEGFDCSKQIRNCSNTSCNSHGLCVNNKCICETGWTGSFCSEAVCDQLNNCSGSGICIRPQLCECFHGFSGDDCSICADPTCNLCDAKCVHGLCDANTRTCICHDDWTGPNCDICATKKCNTLSAVLYVLPTAAGIHQRSENILVYGNNLPFVSSKRYTCLYGNTAADGFYVSSSLVRCTIPSLALPGRYLFNIIPYGSDKAIPFLDKRLIHFTLYNECNQAECEGYCLGAICVCPTDRKGAFCEQTKILPKLNREILSNETLIEAVEGEPYTVKIPIQHENTIFNIETDANGMTIFPNGMVFWSQPIGRIQPYTVNVTGTSLTGGYEAGWNLTVKPMYTPMITEVEDVDDTNMKVIKGIVNYNAKFIGNVPVRMLIYQNDKLMENTTTISTADGHFKFIQYPFDETNPTSVFVIHPGETKPDAITSPNNVTWATFDIEYNPKIKMKPGGQIDENYELTNRGGEVLLNCQLELIIPRDKIQIVKYEKIIKGIAVDESKSMEVTFAAGNTLDNTTLILQFKCTDTPRKLIWQQIEVERERAMFVSYPSEILISIPSRVPPKIATVDIVNKEGYQFSSVPRISIRPDYSPLFLIATKPSLENITEFNNLESTLTLFLSYRPLLPVEIANWTISGDLILFDGNKELFTVKYHNYVTSDSFDFQITVMDELSALNATHFVNDAEIMLRNDLLGYNDKKHTKSDGSVIFFSIIEGTYQLTVKSPTHAMVIMIVQPSFINSSLTIFAPISSTYSPVVEDGKLSLEEINKQQKIPFPKLHFTPSTIMVPVNGTEEMNLLISSDFDGPSDNIAVLPSVEIHEEHLPFTFATADVRNGLGLGDGYHMKSKLSRVSNQTESAIACTVFALQIPYIYMVQNSMSNYMRSVMILTDNRNKQSDKVQLCEVGLQTVPAEASIWVKTTIYCNCAMRVKEYCRLQYVSAASCGSAWKYIPDDTISLQTIATFIVMIAECRTAGVNFHKIRQFLECASSLDSYCLISQQRSLNKNKFSWESQQWTQFDQFTMVNEKADDILQKYFSALKMLTSQTVDIVALYKAFFERLNILLPFKHFEEINNNKWFSKFFESISESSDSGLAISETEFKKLEDEKGGAILAHRWNATVDEWSKISSLSSKVNISGMKFVDARELIISSDRLKTLARQYGTDNPFALLHDYIGRLLSWESENMSGSQQVLKFASDYEDICAYAYSLITPEKLYENGEFNIRLKVINKKKESLESVKVTLEMIQSRADTSSGTDATPSMQFWIGPVMLDGIGSIDHTSKLLPNMSFVASWNLKPVKNMRLIHETEYQAILILKFTQNGRRSVQRIATQTVIFRPRPSLKIYYLISNLTHSKIAQDTDVPQATFNVMIVFMNTGYSNLKNVKVEEIRISVLSKDSVKNFIPYRINGIISSSDSDIEDEILSNFHFIIANIESGKTNGVIHDFKVTTSVNGELIELEDTQTFTIQQFISPIKFLVSSQINPASLFYYDVQKAVMRTIVPLIFVNVNEKSSISDGKPFRQQIITFRLNESQQQLTPFYGQIPYPTDLENDFEVLRVNQITKNGALKLIDPRNVWSSNTDRRFVHFIDDNLLEASEFIAYEIIYGNAELFLRPHFEFPVYNIPLVTENWPHVGNEIAHITATSANQSTLRYELYSNFSEMDDYFSINPQTGVINLKKEIQPAEVGNGYCATVRATDEYGRSETAVVTIGFDGFVKECHKIVNFSDLRPLTYIPSQSHSSSSKPATQINVTNGDANYTSEIPKLYRLSHITTPPLSSTLSSTKAKTAQTGTSEIGGYRMKSFVTRKHGYTKLIATQSVSDSSGRLNLTLDSSDIFQLSSTVASDSRADLSIASDTGSAVGAAESNLNGPLYPCEFGSTDTSKNVNLSTDKSYKAYIIGNTKDDSLLSREEIQSELEGINERRVTSSGSFSSGSANGRSSNELLYITGQRSDISNTTTIDPYGIFITMDQSGLLPESGISAASFTLINVATDDSFKTTEDSNINLNTQMSVSNKDPKEVSKSYSLFSTEIPVEKDLFPVAITYTNITSNHQPVRHAESIYNISTTNTINFYSLNNNLETELSSSENNGEAIVTDDTAVKSDDSENYQSQMTSFHKSTYYDLTSPIPQISEFVGPDKIEYSTIERSNIQPATKIPITVSSGDSFMNSEDNENILEMACRLKDTEPIWGLICDLSKTLESSIEKQNP
ncbi:unnamed protein product [Cercopithifilaria johnstoni]|uniref:Uncharacterized protein n=1 Tax=Cercopithifilaria johnstoni TaxID=2874296 RepID=A0A8J2LQP0_9BILA|nr:unnamed protein product [Cercopithifilaria johnstoni]